MKFYYCGAVTVLIDPRTRCIEFMAAEAPEDILERCRLWAESTVQDLLQEDYQLLGSGSYNND